MTSHPTTKAAASSRLRLERLAQEIDQHLQAVRRILRQPLETEVARGGLTGPQRNVMHALVRSGGLSLKELSRQVGLAHSTVSVIVGRLEKLGLLERHVNSRDRRASRIVATKVVRDYVRDTLPMLAVHPLAEALQHAKQTERKAVLDGVRILRRLLES
jgi:DNA-binding MarR family transcriptional regulator